MFYKYRLDNGRIEVGAPEPIESFDPAIYAVLDTMDTSAYDDHANVYRIVADAVEIDPTYTPPPFDLGTEELKAILKLIIDQLNAIRTQVGMTQITYAQARDAIKTSLGPT